MHRSAKRDGSSMGVARGEPTSVFLHIGKGRGTCLILSSAQLHAAPISQLFLF